MKVNALLILSRHHTLNNMKKLSTIVIIFSLLAFSNSRHEEGMFPLSSLSQLDLKKAGLKIETSEIYSETENSLVNALVRLGGCTGSFISDQGLIVTNHHCVYGTVASLSTPENNYLENGFYASTNEAELKTSLPCKITKSFKDVSEEVLNGIDALSTAVEKQNKIQENIKAIVDEEKNNFPELSIEVSEMLVGKSYTLFRYKVLEDVRIVYVPPKNIGKFGGETDNWEWPRHNGDFSIVRAYENGKPYQPERHLEVNPSGTKEGDFTFILGYPGRTYRNQPAEFLEYQNNYVLPIISSWFDFRIKAIEEYAGNDVAKQLRYSGTLASLNNVTKNFKGKMQGLQRTNVIEHTYEGQRLLKKFAEQNPAYLEYVPLFDKSEALHKEKFKLVTDYLYLNQLFGSSKLFAAASSIVAYNEEIAERSKSEQKSYVSENKEQMDKRFASYFSIGEEIELDEVLFAELLYQLSQTKLDNLNQALGEDIIGKSRDELKAYSATLYKNTKLSEPEECEASYNKNPLRFINLKDPFVDLASRMRPVLIAMQTEMTSINAQIDEIIPRFNDLEMARNSGNFIPDANGTLRFTYGYVKGYEPQDAMVYSPFTTVTGIIEKATGSTNPDYFLQDEIIQKMKTIQPADVLKHPEHNAVVVGFLYNMDTTGGNSGSPIMDAYGRLVGINFDRAYTATINDYAWNESYSRSIGVDIRYVLYIMKYFGEADEVLNEMGVKL